MTTSPPTGKKLPLYRSLYVQVITAVVIGVLLGHFYPQIGESMKPLGDGFIKLVKMVIAPVIFLTVVSGIAGMRELAAVGRIAGKAFAYFLFFSTLALIVGLGGFGQFTVTYFVPSVASAVYSLDAAAAGIIISTGYMTAIAVNLLVGLLVDRYNKLLVLAGLFVLLAIASASMIRSPARRSASSIAWIAVVVSS